LKEDGHAVLVWSCEKDFRPGDRHVRLDVVSRVRDSRLRNRPAGEVRPPLSVVLATGDAAGAALEAADTSGIRLLQKFAKTLASRRQSLLAWYDSPISTGPLEAVNNKIRLPYGLLIYTPPVVDGRWPPGPPRAL
jgi:hypothetical protein